MAYVEEVMNEYRNSLRDLNVNSKPLINMLTMLAEENEQHAPQIVKVIEDEIQKAKANRKLPVLYLIDSIIKNLPKTSYKSLFSKNLVQTFTSVFEQVDEKTRASMFKLRQTWAPLFPNAKLYGIDVKIKTYLDPAWPVTATAPEQTSIHVNPKFLTKSDSEPSPEPEPQLSPELSPEPTPVETPEEEDETLEEQESIMRQQLIAKQQELLRLQQERLELELAEAQEKLNKQRKKNAISSTKSSSLEEPALPDTTVQPAFPESAPPPRDPRLAGRDPRLKGTPQDTLSHMPSHMPHSTTPSATASHLQPNLPVADASFVPPFPRVGGVPIVPPFSGQGTIPPFMQPGQVHVNPGFLPHHRVPPGDFTGEVYHPDSSDDSDTRNKRLDKDIDSKSSSNKPKVPHKEPTTNIRDPRQSKKEMEQKPRHGHDSGSNRNNRDGGFNRNTSNRDGGFNRNSNSRDSDFNKNTSHNRNFNRNSKERDRDPRRSHSPHSSSVSPRSNDGSRVNKSGSKSRDPRLRRDDESRKQSAKHEDLSAKRQEEAVSPNSHNKSPGKHKSPPEKRDGKRHSKEREKSPDSAKSPKYSKTSDKSDSRMEKDKPVQSDNKTETQTAPKLGKIPKRSSKERSVSPAKRKVQNKNENAKQSGSIEEMEAESTEAVASVKTPKRELDKEEQDQKENEESLSKKPRIDNTQEEPAVVDVVGKIQEDISELFGAEDQDYRPVDPKALPLKSPSCKGWDKFKADHPDQYAYDIELKKQRAEQMDVDQRPPEEAQDTDYRINQQPSWPPKVDVQTRRESTEDVAIPTELSMEHHAEILIQAHKHLQEGKISHEQHQTLLQQLGELMKIQKLQEENRRLSIEAEGLTQRQPSVESPVKTEFPVDRDPRLTSPQQSQEDVSRVPSDMDGNLLGPQGIRPQESREKTSPEKLTMKKFRKENFQKEGSPQKPVRKGVPEFERHGPLQNLYPEIPRGPPSNRRPPVAPHQLNIPAGHPDYRGPHSGPLKSDGNFRGPPDGSRESGPPFDGRYDDRNLRKEPEQPGFREPVQMGGRDELPPANKDEMGHHSSVLPGPFIEERTVNDRIRAFERLSPGKKVGPLDRGDIGNHDIKDFEPLDDHQFQMDKSFRPPEGQGFGPPHANGPPDRFENIPMDRREFEFSSRRGFEEQDDLGHPGRMDHGPPDHRDPGSFDRRDHGPDRRDHRTDFGPMDRRDMGPHDRRKQTGRGLPEQRDGSPGRREREPTGRIAHGQTDGRDVDLPGRRDQGPPDMGPDGWLRRDEFLPSRGLRHPDGPDFGAQDRMDMGPSDRRGHRPPDRRDMEPVDRRDELREGRDFGPPGRMDMGPLERRDLVPSERQDFGPHDRRHPGPPNRNIGGPERKDHVPGDEIGMRPDFRDNGPPDRRHLEPPDRHNMRFSEGREFGPPDRRDIGPPGSREHGSLDRQRMGHERELGPEERRGMGLHERRDHRPQNRRDMDQRSGHHRPPGLLGIAPPEFMDDVPREFRDHGPQDRDAPPELRGHGLPDRDVPHEFRDHGPPDRDMPPEFRGHGPPDRDMPPEFRGHGPPDRDMPPEFRGHGPPNRDVPPEFRSHGPPDRDLPHEIRDYGPPHRDVPPEFRGHGPPDRKGHEHSDRRDHRPPDHMVIKSSDRRGHGPPDRMDILPGDRRDNGPPPEWQDHDRRDPGPPDERFQMDPDRRDAGPCDRDGPAWPLGGKELPFNPGKAELKQTVPERRTPPADGSVDEDMRAGPFLDDLPRHDNRNEPSDQKDKPSDRPKSSKKAPVDEHTKGRKSPLLPPPPDGLPAVKQTDGQAKQSEAKTAPVPESQKDKKHIPSLLEMDLKPTPDLKKEVAQEPNDIDPVTGLPPWQPVKPASDRSQNRDNVKQHPKNKQDKSKRLKGSVGKQDQDLRAHDEKRQTKRGNAPPDIGTDKSHLDGKRHPKRRDGPDMGPPDGKRPPNRRDGPPMTEVGHPDEKRHNRRDGPSVFGSDGSREGSRRPNRKDGPPDLDGKRPPNRREGPPPLMGPDFEGNRPPNMRDGPPMIGPGFDGNRPPARWDGPPIMGPDGPRPPFPVGPRGPLMPHGPMVNDPRGPPPMRMGGPDMHAPDLEEDQRWTSFTDMGPEVTEEVVIGNKNYAIKLGDRPRTINFFHEKIEVYADPSKRGIVIDGNLMYKFGERMKDVEIRGRTIRMFYHGKPVNLWIDGQNYEVRVDAPPRNIEVNGKNHKIQIDGRDMMIILDKSEKGVFGGPPRFIYIDEVRMELRFDPPPQHILIDGKLCELMLSMKRPCVNIEGKLHGIRFDGPPREVVINNQVFNIHTDKAVKVKVGNKLHYIALGGPCHELIIDGKWFEMKFDMPPKEINIGNKVLMVHLPGKPPEVKILPEIPPPMPGAPPMMIGNMPGPGPMGPIRPGMEPVRPGMEPMMRPMGPVGPNERLLGPMGPNERPPFPMGPRPGMIPLRPEMSQPGAFPVERPPLSTSQQMGPPFLVPGSEAQARPMVPQPPVSAAPAGGMPNMLSGLFGAMPQPSQVPGIGQGPAPASAPAPAMDINTLLSRLISTGIIKKEVEPASTAPTPSSTGQVTTAMASVRGETAAESKTFKAPDLTSIRRKAAKQEAFEEIPDMTELDISQMKELPNGVIQKLYAGIQCTSCGVRFVLEDEEKTEKYREHLDWHFRQNRRERDEMKVAKYRQWYYGVNDWIQYEEVADTEENARSMFFERQQNVQTTPAPTPSNMSFALITVPEGATVTRCPAATGNDSDDLCAICHEPFEQFWDEELEEWHLRDAIRVNDQTYHPICYEDHTDVSEGTPSPSALPMLAPDFSARKTLSYDESSQDAPNTSFEEKREVVKIEPVVKTEPISDKTNSELTEGVQTASKLTKGIISDVIDITDSPVKTLPQTAVKSEPMDTSDSAIVNQEKDVSDTDKAEVKHEPVEEQSSNTQVPEVDSSSGITVIKKESESSEVSEKDSSTVGSTDSVMASQELSDSVPNNVKVTEAVALATEAVTMVKESSVQKKSESVIGTAEAVAGSPAAQGSPMTQGSGGSTPVQDERSCTPVGDECPGTPVQDEPMVE